MGLLDFLKKDKHTDWTLMSLNDAAAYHKGFTTQQLREAIINIDIEKTLFLCPAVKPEYGCVMLEYHKNDTTKKLCFKAAFEDKDGYSSYVSENVPPEEAFRIMSAYIDHNMEPDIAGWRLEKHIKNMEPATFIQFVTMFTGDKDILARMEECSAAPLNYLKAHKEIIPPDNINENYIEDTYKRILTEGSTKANKEFILLNAFACEMYNAGLMARTSDGPELEEFAAAIEPFAIKHNLHFDRAWFDTDGYGADWCTALEEKWHYDGYVIIGPNTYSSVYYYYICTYEEKEEIMLMAKRAGVDIITYEQ